MDREEMQNTLLVDYADKDEIRGVVFYKGDFIIKLPERHASVSIAICEVLANVFQDETSNDTLTKMLTKLHTGGETVQ